MGTNEMTAGAALREIAELAKEGHLYTWQVSKMRGIALSALEQFGAEK